MRAKVQLQICTSYANKQALSLEGSPEDREKFKISFVRVVPTGRPTKSRSTEWYSQMDTGGKLSFATASSRRFKGSYVCLSGNIIQPNNYALSLEFAQSDLLLQVSIWSCIAS